jgi:integrase
MPKAAKPKRRESVPNKPGIYRSVDARGNVRHEFTYRDSDGKQRWERVEGGVRAAESARTATLARMGRGDRVAPVRNLTFAVATDRYLESASSSLRPRVHKLYETHARIYLLPLWRNRKLEAISVDDVARLIESMREDGKRAWTIRGVLTVLGRIFDFASRRLSWAGQNPVRQLDRSERPRSDQKARVTLSTDELGAVVKAADPHYRLIFQVAASTGLRLGEVLGLRWSAIDFDAGKVSVTGQLDRSGEFVAPKTKRSARSIELPGSVLAELRKHRIATEAPSADKDYCFTTRFSHRPHDHRNVGGRVLRRALKAATDSDGKLIWPILSEVDADEKPLPVPEGTLPTFHSLRHGFAASWIAAGGDLVELSAHLGHGTPAVTASVYAVEFERASRSDERRSRIESMFGDALETPAETNEGTKAPDTAPSPSSDSASVSQISAHRRTRH